MTHTKLNKKSEFEINIAINPLIIFLSKLILIIVIFNVWIKSFFNLSPGTIYVLYKDIIIFFLLSILAISFLVRCKNIHLNKIDFFVSMFILYALFELVWTYYNTDSFIIGLVQFRLYFMIYALYLFFRYFSEIIDNFRFTYWVYIRTISFVVFSFTIAEFILVSLGFVSSTDISSFISNGLGSDRTSSYVSGNYIINRGFGASGSIVIGGILNVVCLAFIFPSSAFSYKKRVYDKLLLIMGCTSVVLSMSKTAWLLLMITIVMMSIKLKSKLWTLLIASMFIFLIIYSYLTVDWLRGTINGTLVKTIPLYVMSLIELINHSSFWQLLFGWGYAVDPTGAKAIGFIYNSSTSLTVGNEVFFVSILKQFGLIGIAIYFVGFIYMPYIAFFNKNSDFIKQGAALALLIAGLSSIHYNAIFRDGVNILACISLFYLASTDNFRCMKLHKLSIN